MATLRRDSCDCDNAKEAAVSATSGDGNVARID